jgi:MGT family glycosyltransferase
MHFGIISPPVPGHIHPFGALGRELICRGHQVTLFQMQDLAERVSAEGLQFVPLGASDHPPGTLAQTVAGIGQLDGLAALRFTLGAIRKTTEMICRDAPAAIQATNVEMLLVDQTEPAGGTVAEHLGIPFVTICNALALNREPGIPPPFTGWKFSDSAGVCARNRAGYAVSDWLMKPITRVIARYRKQWGLPPHPTSDDSFSKLAQISQQPPEFDFPRKSLPASFYYVGPLRRSSPRNTPFPWDRLDGRPLVYASLGTLQNGKDRVFRLFAEACLGLDVQLVITHGGGLDENTASSLPGNPVVVSYAPQLDVLARARLTLTHAGLNTVLDSLACGVPLVTVPITYEQPAIAKRVEWSGTGRVVPFSKLQLASLREAIQAVLRDNSYRAQAQRVRESIERAGGVRTAADVIEKLARQHSA